MRRKLKFGLIYTHRYKAILRIYEEICSFYNYVHFFVLLIQELQKLGICSDDPRLKGTLYELGQLAPSPYLLY